MAVELACDIKMRLIFFFSFNFLEQISRHISA